MFIDDLNKAKELWKDAPLVVRCFVIIGLFLQFSALASLSETIFAWKGFILVGIEFYREWVTRPLLDVLELVGLSLPTWASDALMLLLLVVASDLRTRRYLQIKDDHLPIWNAKIDQPDVGWNTYHNRLVKDGGLYGPKYPWFFRFLSLTTRLDFYVFFGLLVSVVGLIASSTPEHGSVLVLCAYFIVGVVVWRFARQNIKIAWLTPYATSILGVLVLAAVNQGLRTA